MLAPKTVANMAIAIPVIPYITPFLAVSCDDNPDKLNINKIEANKYAAI
jgi:hypothetical protein